ncbi:hypothetical protein BH09PAT4_BH09PAT4_02610 [soil metagenome]
MDFMNRNQQASGRPGTVFSAGAPNEAGQPAQHEDHKQRSDKPVHNRGGTGASKWFRWGGGIAVIVLAVLIGAALALLVSFKPVDESDIVDTTKMQAVFLTNDQVYFGKITSINSKFVELSNIYYLQTSSSTSKTTSSNISLVKLGCELHKPQDKMVINQTQVSFWENLQSDGQVAKAVKAYVDANPNGQKCDTTNQSANPVQGSTETKTTDTTTTNN